MLDKIMKILFLHSLADIKLGGGAEVMVWEQMRGLCNAGHECVLLTTSEKPGLMSENRDGIKVWYAGIKNIYWPYNKVRQRAIKRISWHVLDTYNFLMQSYIREVVELEKPHVASLHNLPGWSSASWKTLDDLDVPAVQVLHDYYAICPKASMYKNGTNCQRQCATCHILRLPHPRLSNKVKAVIGVSDFVLDKHKEFGRFCKVKVQQVIHNARSPESIGLQNIDIINDQHMTIRFGYIGRLDETKGVELLIKAFKKSQLPNSELWIAGIGKEEYENKLRELIDEDSSIVICGYMPPNEFFPKVDISVVPSLWNDNFPSVVFEALAFGKPVIGARRGGIPEMIEEEYNGLLFEPNKIDELIDIFKKLHRDSELLAVMSKNAEFSGKKYLDIGAWVSEYEKIYNKIY